MRVLQREPKASFFRNLTARLRSWSDGARQLRRGTAAPTAEHIHPAVRFSVDGEVLVVLDLAGGRLFRCNPTGTVIWRHIAAHAPAESIALAISRQYEISMADAREAVRSYLHQLRRLQLLAPAASETL